MKNLLQAAIIMVLAAVAIPSVAATTKVVMPKCSGRVVWVIPTLKAYVLNNNPLYGKKPGSYACETAAIARGLHMRPLNIVRPMKHSATPRPTATPHAQSSSSTSVATGENPNVTNLARSQIDIFRTGKIDRSQYGSQINAVLTDTLVRQWSQLLTISGAVTAFNYAGTTNVSGLPIAQYAVTFEHPISVPNMGTTNQWIESIAVDGAGKVVYLTFAPKT